MKIGAWSLVVSMLASYLTPRCKSRSRILYPMLRLKISTRKLLMETCTVRCLLCGKVMSGRSTV